jgi:copper(I)-binding protein
MTRDSKIAECPLVRALCLCVLSVVLTSCGDKEAPESSAARDTANSVAGSADQSESLIARDAWLRQPAPGQRMVAAFVTVENNSDRAYTLNHINSPQADSIEVHRTIYDEGIMSMRPVQHLTVPPQRELVFEPGGYHLMLSDVTGALKPGDQVPLSFHFTEGVTLEVSAEVRQIH